jgi:hypothetical protein
MNKQLKELYDWLDIPQQLTRAIIKDKIVEIDNSLKKTRSPRSLFTPPTVVDISEYCTLRNNGINADHFYDHYQAKGWVVGRVKMKDWKAAVRTWEKNNINKPNQQSDGRQQPLLGRQTADTVRANATGWDSLG